MVKKMDLTKIDIKEVEKKFEKLDRKTARKIDSQGTRKKTATRKKKR